MPEYEITLHRKDGSRIGKYGGKMTAKNEKEAIRRFKIFAGTVTGGYSIIIAKLKHGHFEARRLKL